MQKIIHMGPEPRKKIKYNDGSNSSSSSSNTTSTINSSGFNVSPLRVQSSPGIKHKVNNQKQTKSLCQHPLSARTKYFFNTLSTDKEFNVVVNGVIPKLSTTQCPSTNYSEGQKNINYTVYSKILLSVGTLDNLIIGNFQLYDKSEKSLGIYPLRLVKNTQPLDLIQDKTADLNLISAEIFKFIEREYKSFINLFTKQIDSTVKIYYKDRNHHEHQRSINTLGYLFQKLETRTNAHIYPEYKSGLLKFLLEQFNSLKDIIFMLGIDQSIAFKTIYKYNAQTDKFRLKNNTPNYMLGNPSTKEVFNLLNSLNQCLENFAKLSDEQKISKCFKERRGHSETYLYHVANQQLFDFTDVDPSVLNKIDRVNIALISTKSMCNICSFVMPFIWEQLKTKFIKISGNNELNLTLQYDFLNHSNNNIQKAQAIFSEQAPDNYLQESGISQNNTVYKSQFFEYFKLSQAFPNVLHKLFHPSSLKIKSYNDKEANEIYSQHVDMENLLIDVVQKAENRYNNKMKTVFSILKLYNGKVKLDS